MLIASDSTIFGDVLTVVLCVLLLVAAFVLTRAPIVSAGRDTLVAPSILLILAAGVGALIASPTLRTQGFCDAASRGGANIDHAVDLAVLGGVAVSVALRAMRRDGRHVAVALLVAASLLGVCVALVSLDSATYAVHWFPPSGDMFNCPDSSVATIHRVWFLYPVWGSAAALLLIQAVRAVRLARLPRERETGDGQNDETE